MVARTPQDIDQWMRLMERRMNMLERQMLPGHLLPGEVASPFTKNVPRWQTRLNGTAGIASGVLTNLGFASTYVEPFHSPIGSDGSAAGSFMRYQTVSTEPRYYAMQAGLYLIRANVQWNGNATASRKLHIIYDGDGTASFTTEVANAGTNFGVHQEVVGILPLDVGDYFKIAVYQASGATINIVATGSGGTNTYAPSKLSVIPLGGYEFL